MVISYLSACATSVAGGEPPSNLAPWDVAGIYTKIEGYQQPLASFFPNPYNKDATGQADSVFGQLDRFAWYKGIHYTLDWGSVETAQGVYDWTEADFILNTVAGLTRATGQNKKVMFLLPWKAFSSAGMSAILPAYLRNPQPANYPNGNPRWHRAIGWTSSLTPIGYHLRLQDFRNGLTGNDRAGAPIYTLRDRYYAFLQAMHNRYKDHAAFRGIITTEPTPYSDNEMWDATEYDRDQWFAGRLQLLKGAKAIFTKQLVAEACNFDVQWVTDMTGQNATDGLAVNGIAFTNPNYHTGANIRGCHNAMDFLADIVPIINSCQGLDQDSKSGQTLRQGPANDIFNFSPTPPNYGQPRVMIENPGYVGSTWTTHDPPDMPWVIARAQYLKSNIIVYQHNYASTGNKGAPRFNWVDFYTAMNANTTVMSPNTGGLIQNDPAGGMVTTRPLHVAGD